MHMLQLRAQAKQCLIKHDFEQAEQLLSHGLQLMPGSYKLLRLRSVAYACLQQYRPSLKARASHQSLATHHLDCVTVLAYTLMQACERVQHHMPLQRNSTTLLLFDVGADSARV